MAKRRTCFSILTFFSLSLSLLLSEMPRGRGRKPTAPSRRSTRTSTGANSNVRRDERPNINANSTSAGPSGESGCTPGREDIANMVNEAVKEAMEKMTEQVRQGRCQEQVMEAAYDNQRGGLGEEFELVQDNPQNSNVVRWFQRGMSAPQYVKKSSVTNTWILSRCFCQARGHREERTSNTW